MLLSIIEIQQDIPPDLTIKEFNHLLDNIATYLHAFICYYKYDIILNIHADVSYLIESKGPSRVGGAN